MLSLRPRIVLTFLTCIALVWSCNGLNAARSAQARHLQTSSQHSNDLTVQSFAAHASRIAVMRGAPMRSYISRFTALSRRQRTRQTGAEAGGGTALVTNWTISPAGRQTSLGDLPVNAVLSPDGSHMLVVNSGAGVQSLQVVNTLDGAVLQTIPYYSPHSVFVGASYSPDGKSAYASGGGEDTVHTFSVAADGTLTATGDIVLGTASQNPYPTGLSVSPDSKTLYVANDLANSMAIVDVATKTVTGTVSVGSYPYTTLVSPANGLVYVSNWGDGTVSLVDPAGKSVVATIPVGKHPATMTVDVPYHLLFVADSDSDAVSVIDMATNQEINRVSVAPTPYAPLSSSPVGVAVSPDGKNLYVANAGDNALAVFLINGDGKAIYFQGWIPTAWYPTAVAMNLRGDTLFVTNGKGQGEGPNNTGIFPDPARPTFPGLPAVQGYSDKYCNCTFDKFVGTMNVGTLSTIHVPTRWDLLSDTLQVAENDHFLDASVWDRNLDNPIPRPGGASPIKHVIYIEKENRTYDQVFGDEPFGNGDPTLTMFPKNVTPNLHALAERFGLPDNFYADAQVSADGHNWAFSANTNDYMEKIWPQRPPYAPAPGRNRPSDFEGKGPMPLSPGGYIWDAAAAARITYRDYGNFMQNGGNGTPMPEGQAGTCPGPIAHTYQGVSIPAGDVLCFQPTSVNAATTPNLVNHADPLFRSYDLNYREADRLAEWKREFDQFVANDNLPQLELVRMGNDHTDGTNPGSPVPQYMVAENDAAVGQLVDVVSHSKYWASTAIFITEDDAQNGPDHVDSHRTTSLVISPYTSRAQPRAEHTHYDTAAMLRTIELILGLKPLSKFDAVATPMWQMFSSTPDTTTYTALPQTIPLTSNTLKSYGARESAHMDFAISDDIPMDRLNRILWHAIKGPLRPYPGR